MDKQVDILLGLKCNQKCSFCFQEDESILSNDSNPNLGNILKILIKGKKQGYSRVNIAGGEATIYKEFYPVLKIAKQLGYSQIKLITNGIMFKDYDFAQKTLPFLDDIAISFHSSDKKIHDDLTGMKGSYDFVMNAIENIKSIKPEIQLINHTVITSKNFENLEAHIENIIKLGFKRIDLLNMMPNTKLNKNLFISHKILSKKIISIIDKYNSIINIEVCYTEPCLYKGYEKYITGFDYGRDFLSNREDVLLSWQKTLIDYKIIKKECKNCNYFNDCRGFWDEDKINKS